MAESLIIVDAQDGACAIMAAHIACLTGWPVADKAYERGTGVAAWQRLIVVAPTAHGRVAATVRRRVWRIAQWGTSPGAVSLALLTWPPAEHAARAAQELADLASAHCEPVLVLGPDAFTGHVAEHRIRRWLHPLPDRSTHAQQAEADTQPLAYEHMLDAAAGPDPPTAISSRHQRRLMEPAWAARTTGPSTKSTDDASHATG